MNKEKAYRALGIDRRVSAREAKIAYFKLVKRWHPDQFSPDDSRKPMAEELIRQINLAYEEVQSDLKTCTNSTDVDRERGAGNYSQFYGATPVRRRPVNGRHSTPSSSRACDCIEIKLTSASNLIGRPIPVQVQPNNVSLDTSAIGPGAGGHFDEVLSEIMQTARKGPESG